MSKHTAYQPPTKSNKGNADSETEDLVSKNKNTNLHFSPSHRPAAFRYHPIVFLFERTYCIMSVSYTHLLPLSDNPSFSNFPPNIAPLFWCYRKRMCMPQRYHRLRRGTMTRCHIN